VERNFALIIYIIENKGGGFGNEAFYNLGCVCVALDMVATVQVSFSGNTTAGQWFDHMMIYAYLKRIKG